MLEEMTLNVAEKKYPTIKIQKQAIASVYCVPKIRGIKNGESAMRPMVINKLPIPQRKVSL